MDDYDVCQLCHGEIVVWQDHVCPSKAKAKHVKHGKSSEGKEEYLQHKLRRLDRTEANRGFDFGLDSEEEVHQESDQDEEKINAHKDHKEYQHDLEMR